MPTLNYVLGRLHLDSSPRYTDLIRRIPGFKYDKAADCWTAPAKFPIALAARGVLGDALELTPEATAWAERRKMDAQYAEQFRQGQFTIKEDNGDNVLYPFQEIGQTFLVCQEKVLLADEMGLGKSCEAASAISWLNGNWAAFDRGFHLPILIVCTNSMKHTWKAEMKKWADLDLTVIGGTAPQRAKQMKSWGQEGIIIHWDALRLHSRLAGFGSVSLKDEEKTPGFLNEIEWATVIADEAHKAKDPNAKQTRALWAVSENATYRWALTGTPIAGKAEDLWSILHFLDPEAWSNRSKFLDRYALGGINIHGGFETYGWNPHTEAEMQASIRPHFLRRTKAEVLPQLPPKIYRQVWVEMSPKQAKVYRTIAKELMAQLDSGVLVANSNIVQHTRLGQAASGYLVLDEEGKVSSLDMPSCKVDGLMDLLEESDEQVVVMAESRLLIELCARQLEKAKVSHVCITGRVSPEERTTNVATFQAGGARVCLVTLGAGSEGLTLTAASKLVFLQRSFSMTANLQAQDRIHRIGQTESVEIIDILTANSTDVDRWEISNDKEGIAQQIYHDPHYIRQRLSS